MFTPSKVYESELAHELAAKRLEIEKAERARIADAVTAAEVNYSFRSSLGKQLTVRFLSVLVLRRLRSF